MENKNSKMVSCVKLSKNLEALDRSPFAGELGKRIINNISKEAWGLWLGEQTILINEYRLNPLDEQAKNFLKERMLEFLFAEKEKV